MAGKGFRDILRRISKKEVLLLTSLLDYLGTDGHFKGKLIDALKQCRDSTRANRILREIEQLTEAEVLALIEKYESIEQRK